MRPPGIRYRLKPVENAEASCAAEPRIGMLRLLMVVGPGCNPTPDRARRTESTVVCVGPKRATNCASLRYRRYWGDPGDDTARA